MDMQHVNLTGIPETMLWTLHNRASEAMRPDAWFHDQQAVQLYQHIDYDFLRSFGAPDSSHAMRSLIFDAVVKQWLIANPGGTVVELACGLETQFQRCDDGKVQWLCVDIEEAITTRERFIQPSERCRHLGKSALDLRWMDEVDTSHGVFVTAQGLFMYLDETEVKHLLIAIFNQFSGVELMFDVIPRWFSQKTMRANGWYKTKSYRMPAMPWGVNNSEVDALLRTWSPKIKEVRHLPYYRIRGLMLSMLLQLSRLPPFKNIFPNILHVK